MITAREARARYIDAEKELTARQLENIEQMIIKASTNSCHITWTSNE